MEKCTLFCIVTSLTLVGCSYIHMSEEVAQDHVETICNTNVNALELKSEVEIDMFKSAVRHAKQEPGLVNMSKHQYQFCIDGDAYFLWSTEESGVIMHANDTHTIFTLSDQSVDDVNAFIVRLTKGE
ncbi:hypothetical protein [Halalkalibacter hemicellulosilyticus]|uniref:YhfM-like domain-containing protein n=1 Tax=Halalkalibacter hemicellulosilyticusJCM 9152 TaxID=1236971 RepID=W4QF61_9BACI|nr:hypothetical protein [Halalkalibacter hemicellulosilyticus]GAE29954.1 hypothetical protein JCM9152_1344 [Halalkalibacter hemicellulosilyticusJCM 9152]